MLRNAAHMTGHRVRTQDGPMGEVEDFFFDDVDWRVRYVVANTSRWFGHEVLISPDAFEKVEWDEGLIHVRMTQEQVKEAPAVADKRPVSRQFEAEYRGFFGWPMYWMPYGIADNAVHSGQIPSNTGLPVTATRVEEEESNEDEEPEEAHLWSMKDLDSFEIRALDGEIGHVQDFFIDDTDLSVRYMVVNTRTWLPGKDIPINRHLITALQWENRIVSVNLTRDQIENAPEYDGGIPTPEYELELHAYFTCELTDEDASSAG